MCTTTSEKTWMLSESYSLTMVFIKEFPSSKDWLPGVRISTDRPSSYSIILMDECRTTHHVDHIRKISSDQRVTEGLPNYSSLSTGEEARVPEVLEVDSLSPAPPPTLDIRRSTRRVQPPHYLQYWPNFKPTQ